MIKYLCPKCRPLLENSSSLVGQYDECPLCQSKNVVPSSGKRTRRWWWACESFAGLALVACAAVLVWPTTQNVPAQVAKDGRAQAEHTSPSPSASVQASQVVGEWRAKLENGHAELNFRQDGTCSIYVNNSGRMLAFTSPYRINPSNNCIDFGVSAGLAKLLSDNRLDVKYSDSQAEVAGVFERKTSVAASSAPTTSSANLGTTQPAPKPVTSQSDEGLRVSDVIWKEGVSIHVVEETKRYSDPFVGGVKNTVETRGFQYRVHRGSVKIDNKGPTAKTFTLVIDPQAKASLEKLCGVGSYWEIMTTETKPPPQKVAQLEEMRKQFAEAVHDAETIADFDRQIADAKAVQSVTQGNLSVRARPLQLTLVPGASSTVFVVIGADDYNWYKNASAEERKDLSTLGLGAAVVLLQDRKGTSLPSSSQPAETPVRKPVVSTMPASRQTSNPVESKVPLQAQTDFSKMEVTELIIWIDNHLDQKKYPQARNVWNGGQANARQNPQLAIVFVEFGTNGVLEYRQSEKFTPDLAAALLELKGRIEKDKAKKPIAKQ